VTPVDGFVLKELEAVGLVPSPTQDRIRLIRRVTLDLTGLPPTFQEVEHFLADPSPNAYEQLVERLLASPGYGERSAQHWLDVVRYADSDGFEYDDPRPSAWRYRDWVITAFDEDKPFDQFIVEQIAGDLLTPDNPRAPIPTGLHRLGPIRKNAGNQEVEKNRQELLVEMTDAVGFAFLGLTIGCAKCHDHKFDPITQDEYYSLQAFFAGTVPADPPSSKLEAGSEAGAMKPAEDSIMAIRESDAQPPPTYVLLRGVPGRHGKEVQPRFPEALTLTDKFSIPIERADPAIVGKRSAARRVVLAQWLSSDEHPLTARVMVNRLWQHHFGRGLVSTANDFGLMGAPPSHPELLDWLATELVRNDWSIKHLQRLIVTSATYRQSTDRRDVGEKVDSENVLLWRMPVNRMDAETIRDSALAVSSDLVRNRGGPGVRLRLSKEISELIYKGKWEATIDPAEQARRSIYRFVKRNLRPALFSQFDAPDTLVSCPQRTASTHSGQALALLNHPMMDLQASSLAQRMLREVELSSKVDDFTPYVRQTYRSILSRDPNDTEANLGNEFLREQIMLIQQEAEAKLPVPQAVELALRDYCLVVLNLDEFLFY
jgi:hypothetical protein